MSPKATKDLHVLIIGAGVTGLLLAQGLKKNGVKYSIFEAEPSASEYRPREWTLGVHWALPMLQSLLPDDIWLRTNTTQPDPAFVAKATDTFNLYNANTGELLKTVPTGGMRRFLRTRLRALVSEGIEVNYGKTFSSVSYDESGSGVSAHFADGTSISGDVLIGADGPRSKVRDSIVGERRSEASPASVVMAIATSKYTTEQALYLRPYATPIATAFHPNGTFSAIVGTNFRSSEPENWEFQVFLSSTPEDFKGGDAERLQILKSKAAEHAGTWKNIFELIPEGTSVSFNNLMYWKTVEFDNREGRATLAGDAAHPMTPHRGQGLNHAICDAANLVSLLNKAHKGELSLIDAINEYDTKMIKRGGDEVQEALTNTKMIHDWNLFLQSPLMTKATARGN